MTGPLAGVRVVELAAIGPAPLTGMMLADMGAEVVRIDRIGDTGGERAFAASHRVLDRGRRSVAVDLKHPAAAELVLGLAATSDVLLEGFRPGVAERLGIGPQPALQRNPRLVYGRMTGWGQDGPAAARAGHDINYIALSGALEPMVDDRGKPVPPHNMLGDFGGGGMLLAVGVLAALHHVGGTGEGQVIDAAILDGTALLTAMLHAMQSAGDWSAPPGGNLFDGGAPYYGVYRTADDRWMSVGAIEPQFFALLVQGLGLGAELALADQNDTAAWPAQRDLLRARFATRTRDEWAEVFGTTDACVWPVLAPDEAADHPHLAARAVFGDVDGVTHPAPAPRFARTPGTRGAAPPVVGRDSRAALADWGVDAATVEQLLRDGVVAQA